MDAIASARVTLADSEKQGAVLRAQYAANRSIAEEEAKLRRAQLVCDENIKKHKMALDKQIVEIEQSHLRCIGFLAPPAIPGGGKGAALARQANQTRALLPVHHSSDEEEENEEGDDDESEAPQGKGKIMPTVPKRNPATDDEKQAREAKKKGAADAFKMRKTKDRATYEASMELCTLTTEEYAQALSRMSRNLDIVKNSNGKTGALVRMHKGNFTPRPVSFKVPVLRLGYEVQCIGCSQKIKENEEFVPTLVCEKSRCHVPCALIIMSCHSQGREMYYNCVATMCKFQVNGKPFSTTFKCQHFDTDDDEEYTADLKRVMQIMTGGA
jgi:hypothetical protein